MFDIRREVCYDGLFNQIWLKLIEKDWKMELHQKIAETIADHFEGKPQNGEDAKEVLLALMNNLITTCLINSFNAGFVADEIKSRYDAMSALN